MLKNQKGITLVALVITIVVLIILATVAISFAFNGGLVDRAEQAADFYANDTEYTEQSITNVEHYLNDVLNGIVPNAGA